jgi:hypothetical protein
MLRSVLFAAAFAGALAATHPGFADPSAAAIQDRAEAAAPATEQPTAQAPAWSSSTDQMAPAAAGFGKNSVTVGFGWG